MTTLTTTEHGLELDEAFAEPASEERLQATAQALRDRGHTVLVVDDPDAARTAVLDLPPPGRSVFTTSPETLEAAGFDEEIDRSDRFDAIRPPVGDRQPARPLRPRCREGRPRRRSPEARARPGHPLRRFRLCSWSLEDVRFRREHGRPSTIGKTLITEREVVPGRSTVVLVRAVIGF